jgi:hypothetical protein
VFDCAGLAIYNIKIWISWKVLTFSLELAVNISTEHIQFDGFIRQMQISFWAINIGVDGWVFTHFDVSLSFKNISHLIGYNVRCQYVELSSVAFATRVNLQVLFSVPLLTQDSSDSVVQGKVSDHVFSKRINQSVSNLSRNVLTRDSATPCADWFHPLVLHQLLDRILGRFRRFVVAQYVRNYVPFKCLVSDLWLCLVQKFLVNLLVAFSCFLDNRWSPECYDAFNLDKILDSIFCLWIVTPSFGSVIFFVIITQKSNYCCISPS